MRGCGAYGTQPEAEASAHRRAFAQGTLGYTTLSADTAAEAVYDEQIRTALWRWGDKRMKRAGIVGVVLALWILLMVVLWPSAPVEPDRSVSRPAEVLAEVFPGPEAFVGGRYPEDVEQVVRVMLPGEDRLAWLIVPDGMDVEAMRAEGTGLWYDYGYEVSHYRVYTLAQPYGVERVIYPDQVTVAGVPAQGTVTALTDDLLILSEPDPEADRAVEYHLKRTEDSVLYDGVKVGRTVKAIYDEASETVQWAREASE